MPLDAFLPQYDFSERHVITVDAPVHVVRRALDEWHVDESLLWRLLLVMRGMGAPRGTLRQWAEREGFLRLTEGEEEIYGRAGRFWRVLSSEENAVRTPPEFVAFDTPGFAIAAMSIATTPVGSAATCLTTETRIRTIGQGADRRFRVYWLFVRPFSGLLRHAMLRGIRKRALALNKA